ncbi:MAG: hypothetical protein IIA14_15495, partial [SAR324 cluster bacterium]|nr:hypothetical protein [SAR324 cluster bacterium]
SKLDVDFSLQLQINQLRDEFRRIAGKQGTQALGDERFWKALAQLPEGDRQVIRDIAIRLANRGKISKGRANGSTSKAQRKKSRGRKESKLTPSDFEKGES